MSRHDSGAGYPGTRGRLRITSLEYSETEEEAASDMPAHHVILRAGRGHAMEDNDIRGFLDGSFYVAWNQPGQSHVRVGREGYGGPVSSSPAGQPPGYGEHELFRLVQRWEAPDLPPGAAIEQAMLRMTVDDHCDRTVRVFLYRILKDWEPGVGGEERNNISVPRPGEVWWCYAKHGEHAWSLPGVGFHGNGGDADAESMPLADCVYRPGTPVMEWSSRRLAEYLNCCVRDREPVRLLLKAADTEEDTPGAQLDFYSADHGGILDQGRRPEVHLSFTVPGSRLEREFDVHLEHGREVSLPVQGLAGGHYWIDVDVDPGYELPLLEVSGAESTSPPSPWGGGIRISADSEPVIKLRAARCVIQLGSAFTDRLRDTWITSGPPEDQTVEWVFRSPTGAEHAAVADYQGDYTWRVTFDPDELGPWVFRWRHGLAGHEEGPEGRFDVLSDDPVALVDHIRRLAGRLEERRSALTSAETERDRIRFSRLQRALVSALGPEGLRSADGRLALEELRNVRSLLWGRAVPKEIPLRSMPLLRAIDGRPIADPIPYHRPPEHPALKVTRRVRRLARRIRNGMERRMVWMRGARTKNRHGEDER